jgi:prepilin-type processing-associated H-X9-DG protein
MCPSDSFIGQTESNSRTKLSYSLNDELYTEGNELHTYNRGPGLGFVASQSDMSDPSGTILLMEESETSALGNGLNDGTFYPREGSDFAAIRHNGGGNWLMGDTHAKWYKADQIKNRQGTTGPVIRGPRFYMFFMDEALRNRCRQNPTTCV